jgi:hypothetical protein
MGFITSYYKKRGDQDALGSWSENPYFLVSHHEGEGCEPLVDLFGKKKLDDRISELEAKVADLQQEKEELSRILERREEKIRRLASAHQEASLALKAAQQRLTEPGIQATQEKGEPGPQGTGLGRSVMERLLRRLAAIQSPEEDLITAYIPVQEDLPPEEERVVKPIRSERGWVILDCPQLFTLVLVPPFPVEEKLLRRGRTFQLDPIGEMLETPTLVVSAHAGDTMLGFALNKDGFEAVEVVKTQVKEKHSKGGWSQRRFERLREEDIRNHAEEASLRLAEMIGRYRSIAKYAVLGGDPSLLRQISSKVDLPLVTRRMERHDSSRPVRLLDEVYGFTCYRS